MEYVFGTVKRRGVTCDSLKTKNDKHTNLSGSVTLESKYPDQIVTDRFMVIERYRSEIDAEGNCYDWYVIDKHYRYVDKYTPNIGKVEERIDGDIASTQEGLMETYDLAATNSDGISDCRAALEELYELSSGGLRQWQAQWQRFTQRAVNWTAKTSIPCPRGCRMK
ncbi:MAG: hypothetical protein IJ058_13475 [Lachnospiraceae bacterium]|nr:hypothetical protein [Lachnospiraceae bacterium]